MAGANLYRFSSKELHEPSGLVYYLYRHYDTTTRMCNDGQILNQWGSLGLTE